MAPASKRVVRYLPAAEEDLFDIYHWILQDAPGRGAAFLERIDPRIGSLAAQPRLGRVPKHPRLREAGYRVLTLDAYLVFYVLRQKTVEIHRIVHGSRSLDDVV